MPDRLSGPLVADALRNAVTEVLEKMFFIRVLEDPREAAEFSTREPPCGEPEIAARVTFHGEPSGSLSLRLDRRVARAIAADFLGEEEPVLEPRLIEEVIGELVNMVCGAFLSSVESSVTFRLDTPVIVNPEALEIGGGESAVHSFPIGGSALTVTLRMEEQACFRSEEFAF